MNGKILKNSCFILNLCLISVVCAENAPASAEAAAPSAAAEAPAAVEKKVESEPVTPVPAVMRFRSGTIYSAEIGNVKPVVDDEVPFDMPSFEKPAWAEIVVKMDKGRSLSRYDFVLSTSRREYLGYAVAEGEASYSGKEWFFKNTDPTKYYRLLFAVEAPETDSETISYTLKFKLFPSQFADPELKLKNRRDQSFTPVREIPENGALYLEPKVQPSAPVVAPTEPTSPPQSDVVAPAQDATAPAK